MLYNLLNYLSIHFLMEDIGESYIIFFFLQSSFIITYCYIILISKLNLKYKNFFIYLLPILFISGFICNITNIFYGWFDFSYNIFLILTDILFFIIIYKFLKIFYKIIYIVLKTILKYIIVKLKI